ncbi:MAG: hypothetical protein R3A52_23715 [Polyangiales bacterium]
MERPGGRGLRNDTFFYPSNVSAVELSRVKPGRLLPPSDFQRVWLLTAPGRAQIAAQVLAAAQAASASKPEPPKG